MAITSKSAHFMLFTALLSGIAVGQSPTTASGGKPPAVASTGSEQTALKTNASTRLTVRLYKVQAIQRPTQPVVPLPDAPSSYQPLSARDKYMVFVNHTYSPYTFVEALFDAGYSQATDGKAGYGQGMEGFGKRYGASLAGSETDVFFGRFLLPALLHQDPRYFRAGTGRLHQRAGYAASRVLFTRQDSGATGFNYSKVLSAFISSAVSDTYRPDKERGFGDTVGRAVAGLASAAGTNLLREFWPDIHRKFSRYEPEKVKSMADKVSGEKD